MQPVLPLNPAPPSCRCAADQPDWNPARFVRSTQLAPGVRWVLASAPACSPHRQHTTLLLRSAGPASTCAANQRS